MLPAVAASLGPIRAGAGALAAGGLLILAADVLHPAIPITTIASDPTAFASESGATTSVLHGILFQLGYMGLLFGLLALYSYLSWNGKDALARTALLVSLAQIAVVLSFIGVATNAIPLASGSYLAGHHDALDWITKLPTSPAGLIGGVSSSVLGVVGAVLFAIAFWRSGAVPKPAALLWAVAFAISSFTPGLPSFLRVVDGLLVSGACIWLALVLWRASGTPAPAQAT